MNSVLQPLGAVVSLFRDFNASLVWILLDVLTVLVQKIDISHDVVERIGLPESSAPS